MAHPLDGALMKLERANEHLTVLDEETVAWLEAETKPYLLSPRHRRKRGRHQNRVLMKVIDQPPPRLGVIAGDCIHCIRCSLDYVVYELDRSLPRPQRNKGKTQFPVVTQDAMKYRASGLPYMASLPGPHRAVIRKLQPYQRRDKQEAAMEPLAILNAFSNRDKHRLVPITVAQVNENTARIYGSGVQAIYDVRHFTGPVEDEAELLYIDYAVTDDPEPDVHIEGNIAIDVAFPNGLGARQTLYVLIDLAADICGWFEPVL